MEFDDGWDVVDFAEVLGNGVFEAAIGLGPPSLAVEE
jgi:hypothetical protein